MKFKLLSVLLFPLLVMAQNQPTERTLHENWEFSSNSNTLKGSATVPGNIHTDLWNAEIIEDPYKGTNELNYQWIQDSTWVYTTTFQVSEQELASHLVFLEFEGLDTYATIYLNEMEIGKSDNMFLAWQNEVKTWLKEGTNSLKVVFKSPYND